MLIFFFTPKDIKNTVLHTISSGALRMEKFSLILDIEKKKFIP